MLVDTGPLVAALNGADQYHDWVIEQLHELRGPMLTCEALLSEALVLMRRIPRGAAGLWSMLEGEGLAVKFSLAEEATAVAKIMLKYADVPMSLADACLVRMSELNTDQKVLTLDRDFQLYRRHRHRRLPLLLPP